MPSATIVAVDIMFRVSFVADPAFIRVDPVMTSGPTLRTIMTSASSTAVKGAVTAAEPIPSSNAATDEA